MLNIRSNYVNIIVKMLLWVLKISRVDFNYYD